MDELRFTILLEGTGQCEVFAATVDGKLRIKTVNVVGDCVVTWEDLDDETKSFFLKELARVVQETKGIRPSSS